MKKRILTGDRPTGPLHLGHYVGSLANRVKLQDSHECFFIIADFQVLTDHLDDTARISQNIREIALDYLSVGIDPGRSTIFIQSLVPQIAELTMYFSMLVSVGRLKRNPTVKEELAVAGMEESEMSYGFFGYPVSQAADILVVRANLVPVGEDQLPHLEQTREIARGFNRRFDEVFPVPEALLGEFSRLPGIDGHKMSKSRGNAIYLSDSPEDVARKVKRAYTDPTRIRATDPGHIKGNVVFAYLEAFLGDEAELEGIKSEYKAGGISDSAVKARLTKVLNDFLAPIQERRREFAAKPRLVNEIIEGGVRQVREEGRLTLEKVREAMRMDYTNLR
jgi:tryptophanyl-tRNA synthetase